MSSTSLIDDTATTIQPKQEKNPNIIFRSRPRLATDRSRRNGTRSIRSRSRVAKHKIKVQNVRMVSATVSPSLLAYFGIAVEFLGVVRSMHFEIQKIFWDVFKNYVRDWGNSTWQKMQGFWAHTEGDDGLLEEANTGNLLSPKSPNFAYTDIVLSNESIFTTKNDLQVEPFALPSTRRHSRTCLGCRYNEQLPILNDIQSIANVSTTTYAYDSAAAAMPLALTAYLAYLSRHRFKSLFDGKIIGGLGKAKHEAFKNLGKSKRMTSVYI